MGGGDTFIGCAVVGLLLLIVAGCFAVSVFESDNGPDPVLITETLEATVTATETVRETVSAAPDDAEAGDEGDQASEAQPDPEPGAAGPSARCEDGSLSYSDNRSGTCSHHGEVAEWLPGAPAN